MSFPSLLAILLCIALAGFSLIRIARLPVSLPFKLLLGGLRVVLFALLAAMFFEPVLTFERLSAPTHEIPVLVDGSRSMTLFSPEESVLPALARLRQWNRGGHRDTFAFYCFGDSLRSLMRQPSWSDRHSLFPADPRLKALRQAASLVVVSDGNWSNPSLPQGFFSDKTVCYLPLTEGKKVPYLRMEMREFPPTIPADSPGTVGLVCEGNAAGAGSLTVGVYEGNTAIQTNRVGVRAGFFTCPVSLRLPARPAGRHLYRFEARLPGDSALSCSRYATQTVIPGRFTYSLVCATPSLDVRFLRLALEADHDFVELPPGAGNKADLVAFFGWNGRADEAANRLKRTGTALFLGTVPGGAALIPSNGLVLAHARNDGSASGPFEDLDLTRLPPPTRFLDARKGPVRMTEPILSGIVAGTKRSDTLPLLFAGTWKDTRAIVFAATGLWTWDLWPLANEPAEERAFSVSNRFVSLVKGMLVDGLCGQLLVYPPEPATEIDSLALRVLLPADLPSGSEVRLSCSFASNALRYDTTIAMNAATPDRSVRLRPLPAGRYRIDATAQSGGSRFTFTDSLTVGEDRSELMVAGQNLALLQEIGRPLTDLGDTSLASLVAPLPGARRVQEHIPIRRTWPLLLCAFFVLAGEWIARRKAKLD